MGALVRDASVSARLSPPASIWALALPEGAGGRQVAWVNAVQPGWEHHRGASSHHRFSVVDLGVVDHESRAHAQVRVGG
jgi:hypothetical protein